MTIRWIVGSFFFLLSSFSFIPILSWMRFHRLLVLLWFGYRLLFVVESLVWRWGGCIWEWLCQIHVLLRWQCRMYQDLWVYHQQWFLLDTFLMISLVYTSKSRGWNFLFLSFGSLLRLCFMDGKFNDDFGRRCLWIAWSYATAVCLRVLKRPRCLSLPLILICAWYPYILPLVGHPTRSLLLISSHSVLHTPKHTPHDYPLVLLDCCPFRKVQLWDRCAAFDGSSIVLLGSLFGGIVQGIAHWYCTYQYFPVCHYSWSAHNIFLPLEDTPK